MLVIRVSKIRLTAINECGLPLLADLMDLGRNNLQTRNALLALAGHFRMNMGSTMREEHRRATLNAYSTTIADLRESIQQLQHDGASREQHNILPVLGSVLLLSIIHLPIPSTQPFSHEQDWSSHVGGLVSIIDSLNPQLVKNTNLGMLIRSIAAYLDIGAFALGRHVKSRRAWLTWGLHLPMNCSPRSEFTSLEVIVGYPESLITILAIISAIIDDNRNGIIASTLHELTTALFETYSAETEQGACTTGSPKPESAWARCSFMLEEVLSLWQPPDIPARISTPVVLALSTAWELMRNAALLYLWRGGFHCNVLTTVQHPKSSTRLKLIREMISSFHILLFRAEEDGVSIMNVMTWPLVVVGNECCAFPSLQSEIITILDKMRSIFGISHLKSTIQLLRELWQRAKSPDDHAVSDCLSLESLSEEFKACVPLF